MGRKKKKFGAKEKRVYFRVSESLHEAIVRSAKKNGLSVSECCRLALINQPIQKLPVIIHDERKILQELRNINKVIVDLDQILQYLSEGEKKTMLIYGKSGIPSKRSTFLSTISIEQ